ncbi:NAD(P)-dependent oxidoreductase [Lichenicoccus sp.]|uniref:NAD(P)-dependent oxidoreductase n=1 Tax=Lichenicoccus sp. TaxID=2781899 RepID=UPI003D13446C
MTEQIGFIGLGYMGHGMAKNLVEKGFPLTVMAHRKRETIDDLKQRGAVEVETARAMAKVCDIVVLCVTGSTQVEAILNGPDGLAAAGKPLMVIDCSTSEPAITVRLAQELAPQGITLIDAPLSRTPKEAWAGTLDVMLGGASHDVRRARPVLETFAGRIVETGATGSAHMMKLLNNFVSLGYGALYAEALMLGAKAGVSAQTFHAVIGGGRMDCPFFQTYFEYVVGGNRDAHKFTLDNALKDLTYLVNFASASAAANPVGAAVRNSYALAIGLGRGGDYVPMLTDALALANKGP